MTSQYALRESEAARKTEEINSPVALGPARLDWSQVKNVLVVRLRSIGDTVLSTSSLSALRRFLPHARIDLLLEDWVAPLLTGCTDVDRIITVKRGSTWARLRLIPQLRGARYDLAFNLHGGTTATLLLRASGARHRVGYANYRYSNFYNHVAPPAAELWKKKQTHSVEQQLALLGWMGVPVSDRPPNRLPQNKEAEASVARQLESAGLSNRAFALIHPAAAFASKQWATENFARVAEYLHNSTNLTPVVTVAEQETTLSKKLESLSKIPLVSLPGLSLPEVTALARRARLFVGNDSGIAHIAAAVETPSVVIFGSSNVAHWGPWTPAPSLVVREEMPCAPCAGYTCSQFDAPECIRRVPLARVQAAIEKMLSTKSIVEK